MTDSASITVTNHRLRKAMTNVNDDDLKSHTKKMGEKLKSELKLRLGEILKIYPYRDKCEVKIKGTSETETCLIAHDILSEGMNVSGFPKGTVTHEKAEEVIIPSETIYGIILDVDVGNKKQKCIVSYINLDRKHTPNNASKGEYKIQVGKNVISLTDKYININSDNLFINGLPYTEAYKPLVDYHDKEEIGDIVTEIDDNINEVNDDLQSQLNSIIDMVYPVGSIYMSINSTNPQTLFGGTWERIKDTFLLASGDVYPSDGDVSTAQHGESNHTLTVDEMPKHKHDLSYRTGVIQTGSSGTYYFDVGTSGNWYTNSPSFKESGGNKAHNNMPPYMSVYMWKRIR